MKSRYLHRLSLPSIIALQLVGCSDRQHRNPFDPQTTQPIASVAQLDAIAGDGRVDLTWDYTHFEDISALRLHRSERTSSTTITTGIELDGRQSEYSDRDVANGTEYEYQLGLVISGEGERLLDTIETATPGRAHGWVADSGSGLVWRVAPDGRNSVFAQGRFSGLSAIAVNRGDRSCWVADRLLRGLYRITETGELEVFEAGLGPVSGFAIDSAGGLAWAIDDEAAAVRWFDLTAVDSLRLHEVDASFVNPVALAPALESCWIADSGTGRVLLYHRDGSRPAAWEGVEDPVCIATSTWMESTDAAGRSVPGEAWLLMEGGAQLVKLSVGGDIVMIDFPLGEAIDLEVDETTGSCWVLGRNDVVAFDSQGAQFLHWTDLPSGLDLSLDSRHRQVWITSVSGLWKLAMDETDLTLLSGFTRPFRVAVDPG